MTELSEPQRLWVEALRSGEYEQGRVFLQTGGSYCCLGVGRALYEKHVECDKADDTQICILHDRVAEWLDITHSGRLSHPIEHFESLIHLNDTAGYTFSQIADVIESGNLEPYDGA